MKEYHFSQIDSTNNLLRTLIASGEADHLTYVTADYQTSGRGQIGNTWESEAGKNLLLSVALFPKDLDVHRHFSLSMAVSVAIVEAIETQGVTLKLKWPNDVYYGDKKLGGILIENNIVSSQISSSIVGLGLNVNQEIFRSDAPNPISLKNILKIETDVKKIGVLIVENIGKWMERVDDRRYDIKQKYMSYLYRFDGKYYRFLDAQGEFVARIVDVEVDGHLVLEDEGGNVRRYLFKEVSYLL